MSISFERAALAACAAAAVLASFAAVAGRTGAATRTERFEDIVVRKITVVDAGGATRLVITGKPLPDARIAGTSFPTQHGARTDAGLLFYNDDGDEQGGLTYSGGGGAQGEALTFDAWRQDQSLEIQHSDTASGSDSFIAGNELPRTNLATESMTLRRMLAAAANDDERRTIRARWRAEGRDGYQRWLLGNVDSASQLVLKDAKGQARLRLAVAANGEARIDFLDDGGNVTKSVVP